jgi:sugar phosphate isomerase/epimerase
MSQLGIEQLTVLGLKPLEFVDVAADLGCDCISMGLSGMPGYPPFSLREDAGLRRELIAALRDRGISISLGEGCIVRPGRDVRDFAADLDIFQELGAERINTVSMDPDLERSLDQFGVLAEMSSARGMTSSIELSPNLTISNLASAVAAVRHVGRKEFALLLDTMHLGRSGATAAEIAALDPAMIGYVQLCDAPLEPTNPNYMDEATFDRMIPGEGELPLREYLSIMPRDVVVSLEVPSRTLTKAGISLRDRLERSVKAARALLNPHDFMVRNRGTQPG